MSTEWRITQVLEKINLLAQDPTPDAKAKKQLKYMDERLHAKVIQNDVSAIVQ